MKKQLKDRDTEVRRLSSMHNERELSSVKDLESKMWVSVPRSRHSLTYHLDLSKKR